VRDAQLAGPGDQGKATLGHWGQDVVAGRFLDPNLDRGLGKLRRAEGNGRKLGELVGVGLVLAESDQRVRPGGERRRLRDNARPGAVAGLVVRDVDQGLLGAPIDEGIGWHQVEESRISRGAAEQLPAIVRVDVGLAGWQEDSGRADQ
jgi:hypothetical protein